VPSYSITSQDILRYIHRSTDDSQYLPQLTGEYVDVYKGEIVVNYSREAPALYIRAGNGTSESIEDSLVRIGNIIISEVEPYAGETSLNKKGLIWYDTYNKHLFIHNGVSFIQVTNALATELLPGIVRQATLAETVLGEESSAVVSPSKLKSWASYYEFNTRRRGTKTVYVCNYDGDDSAANDGSDPSIPFLTINRALIEVGRRNVSTVVIQSGDYLVDNRRGVSDVALISPTPSDVDGNLLGPINPRTISGVVSEIKLEGDSGTFVITGGTGWVLHRDQQLFFEVDGEYIGHVIVESALDTFASNPIYFRKLKGKIVDGAVIKVGHLASFNASSGGLIIPASCHIITEGNVYVRPLFIPTHTLNEVPERSYLFKFAQGCTVQGLIFKDSEITSSHYLYSCMTNATADDLFLADFSFNAKLKHLFGDGILFSTLHANYLPFLRLTDVSLVSYYGASLLDLDASYIEGFKDVVISNVTCASSQQDINFVVDDEPVADARHWAFKVDGTGYSLSLNGGYVRYTPELIIAPEWTDTTVNIDGLRWDP
jgi:hypothetical protein